MKVIQNLEDVVQNMVELKINPLTLDPWGNEQEVQMYKIVDQYFRSTAEIKLGKFKLYANYTPGGGGGGMGMGAYPPEYKLFILLNFENKA